MDTMRIICLSLALLAFVLIGCQTVTTDATGKPDEDGAYTSRRVCGVEYSRAPTPTAAQVRSAKIERFLGVVAGIAFLGAVACAGLGVLVLAGRITFGLWDEGLMVFGTAAVMALAMLWWYAWIPWIALGGLAAIGGYRAAKAWWISRRDGICSHADAREGTDPS